MAKVAAQLTLAAVLSLAALQGAYALNWKAACHGETDLLGVTIAPETLAPGETLSVAIKIVVRA